MLPSTPTSPSTPIPPSSPTFSPPATRSHTLTAQPPPPSLLAPLQEVAGSEDIVRVHVTFSMLNLSQIEAHLGSYTTNPSAYVKQFQYLLQSYSLTYHDIYLILFNTLLPEECRRVWEQARTYADEVH
jgi:hypothetical protein